MSKPKQRRPKVLTKGELAKYSARITEIEAALELCGDQDDDVWENLQAELEQIIEVLKTGYDEALRREKKFKRGDVISIESNVISVCFIPVSE